MATGGVLEAVALALKSMLPRSHFFKRHAAFSRASLFVAEALFKTLKLC
jgi:hypothetical protein